MGKSVLTADARRNRRGIQSVEIGIRVLETLRASGGPCTLSQLAKTAELAPSNCHRYLVSFLRMGLVEQEAQTNRYRFGHRMVQLGLSALSQLDSITIGTEALIRLIDATGYTGLLAIWGDSGPVIIRWMPGRMAVRTTLSAGSALPVLGSATGRVFLAYLPQRQTEKFVAREAQGSREDPARLMSEVRATGLAQVTGSYIPGLSAAAAPILDAHGEATAVLCLVGLADGFPKPIIRQLKTAAKAASASLGACSR